MVNATTSEATVQNNYSSNMKIVIIFAALFAVTVAQSYPEPAYKTPESYAPQPYSFAYEVNDAPSYNNYGHSENSDGNVVTGSYRVLLPDGRTQIVNYRADKNGYVADVKYEGEAKYSEYNKPSAPVYKAPAYKAPATPSYPAPPVAYKTPAPPAYKAPAAPAYQVPQAPVYKPAPASASVAPVYKVPATPPVYKAPPAAGATPVYRAPATPVYKTPVAPVYKVPATTPVVFKSPTVISSPWTPIRSN